MKPPCLTDLKAKSDRLAEGATTPSGASITASGWKVHCGSKGSEGQAADFPLVGEPRIASMGTNQRGRFCSVLRPRQEGKGSLVMGVGLRPSVTRWAERPDSPLQPRAGACRPGPLSPLPRAPLQNRVVFVPLPHQPTPRLGPAPFLQAFHGFLIFLQVLLGESSPSSEAPRGPSAGKMEP